MTMLVVIHEQNDVLMIADSRMGNPLHPGSPLVPKIHANNFCAIGVTFADQAFAFLGGECTQCRQAKPEHWMSSCSGFTSISAFNTAVQAELQAGSPSVMIAVPTIGVASTGASFLVSVLQSTEPSAMVQEGGWWHNGNTAHYCSALFAALNNATSDRVTATLPFLGSPCTPRLRDAPQWSRWQRDPSSGIITVDSYLYQGASGFQTTHFSL